MIGAANTRSRGMAFGEIASMEECERAVRTAIQGAQKMANLRVDHVIVGFSGGRPRSYGVAGEVEVENGTVAERDIGAVLASCDVPDYGHDREALHALPVNFALDGRSGLTDPRGQIGRDLAVDMHLVTVGAAPLRNILHCVRRCDLELGGIVVSSYASGVASLVEDEQELGAACVDIGAGATGVSIFLRRQMIYSDAVRMGGQHVTSDISQGLQVSMQDAERLKTMHGGLVATGLDDRDMIELPSILGDWDNDRRQIEPLRADRGDAAARRGDPRGGAGAARRLGLRVPAEPAHRADRRLARRSRGSSRSRRASSGGSAGSASRSGFRGCRSRPPARPSRPRSASPCTSPTRRTNAGTSRCRPTGTGRGGWRARFDGSRTTGN